MFKNGETRSLNTREDDECETMDTLVIHRDNRYLYRDKMHPVRANKTRSWIRIGRNIRFGRVTLADRELLRPIIIIYPHGCVYIIYLFYR